MHVTVIVCTYNRSALLRTALKSIAASRMPADCSWEILVADNCSTDDTRQVVEQVGALHPGRLRWIFEPRPGKSYALNTAVLASNGSILAFVDDDVTVDADWLRELTAPLLTGPWVGAGGRVLAQWSLPSPGWLDPEGWMAVGPLVQFGRGLSTGPLNVTPVGANMAFHRDLFARYGGFRTDLGPRPGSEIRDEDSEFVRRLLRAGEPLHYTASAIVYHPVTRERLTQKYFLAWWYAKGRTEIREHPPESLRWRIAGVPLYLLRRTLRRALQWMLTLDEQRRFDSKVCVWKLVGEIVECRYLATNPAFEPESANVSR